MAMFPFRYKRLKILSVVIAAMLWLMVSGERVVERVMRAPVEFQNLPSGLELVGNPPDTVEVRLRGSSGALSRIGPADLSTVLDLRTARPGRRLFHLTPTQVNKPYGIDVVQVGPSTVVMEFENSGVKTVPVEPDIDGQPALGFEIVDVTSVPATVEVAGPESALKGLIVAVTEPVSLNNDSRTVRETVTIGVQDSSLRLTVPQSAVVTVKIEAVKKP
jgi:YbbR domain-containing protein